MKILLIHNSYGKYSGEEAVVDAQRTLLEHHGHEVRLYSRSSGEINGIKGQVNAFISGFYNTTSLKGIRDILDTFKPDIVHIHNLYPLISPSILPVIRKSGIPIVMTVHNYRLLCPNGLFFTHNEICQRCTSGLKELNCIFRNCENSQFKSIGYASRNMYARLRNLYGNNVSQFICLTQFQKGLLEMNGFNSSNISVIPNTIRLIDADDKPGKKNKVFGFAGRVSISKGAHLILSAADLLPNFQFELAGFIDPGFITNHNIPKNVKFLGQQTPYEMLTFYQNIGFLIVPSIWYEGFPMVVLEGMKNHLPIIAPRLAGFPEIIGDGVNGLLFNPGDAADLAEKMQRLWDDPELCLLLGEAGRRKLESEYSEEKYYERLMKIYNGLS